MEALEQEKESYRQICHEMYCNGVIKQNPDGSFVAVEDASERESIRSKVKMSNQISASQKNQVNEFQQPLLDDDVDKMDDLG